MHNRLLGPTSEQDAKRHVFPIEGPALRRGGDITICDTAARAARAAPEAAIKLACAGGYLRNLTEKARGGAFSLGPMLMALIRANLRKGSQKMRA